MARHRAAAPSQTEESLNPRARPENPLAPGVQACRQNCVMPANIAADLASSAFLRAGNTDLAPHFAVSLRENEVCRRVGRKISKRFNGLFGWFESLV